MYSTRVLELIQIFSIYTILVFGLAEIIARPFTRGKGLIYRICTDMVVGNFYIINMMFLLAYLKCLYQPIMIVLFLLGAGLIRFFTDRERMTAYWKHKYDILCRILKREYGSKLVKQKVTRKTIQRVKGMYFNLLRGRVLEGILLLAAMAINIYYYSYQALNFVSYAAPDVEVHLYWIQSLVGGELFPAGVYPFGMHCVGAALSLIFGVSAVTVGRMLGVVTSFYIMLLCYLLVKSLCRLKYAPIVGFMIFTIANLTVDTTYMRYSAMISQEYAMLFLVPVMYFLYLYLNEKGTKELVLFGMSFSLTIAVHFYITAVACFFFLAIGIVYLYRMMKQKMLVPIILCGIISTFVAVAPLLVGLCMGYELEQSFIYGASVIMNDSDMYADSTGNTRQEEEQEEEVEEETINYTPELIIEESSKQLENYVFKDIGYLWICVIPLILVFVDWIIRLCKGCVTNRTLEYLSQMLYLLFILVELLLSRFELPVIIEPKRMGIFIAYMLPLLMAIPLEMFYELLKKYRSWGLVCNVAALGCLGLVCFYIDMNGMVKELPTVYYFQTTGAMKAACDIIKHYEKDSWTIVSPVNETTLTYNHGYHYELWDFITELEDYKEGMELYIPTEYVFFYVEKMPIQLYGYSFSVDDEILRKRDSVSVEAAMEEIGHDYQKADEYYKYKRLELMSRMYYWAKAYQNYFPDEMTVFYEDDEIVVYRLKQNTYALNNLAIDYREELLYE